MKVYCDVHSCTDSRPMYCPQCVTARKKFAADACTKCADQLIVKEYLCERCYQEHNEWLRGKVEEREMNSLRQQWQMANAHVFFDPGKVEESSEEDSKIEELQAELQYKNNVINDLRKNIERLENKSDTMEDYIEGDAIKERKTKAAAFDYASKTLRNKVKKLRNQADQAREIEVENELRETLRIYDEVDSILMAAFVRATFGKKTQAEVNKGKSLRKKLTDLTVSALEKKLNQEAITKSQKALEKYKERK